MAKKIIFESFKYRLLIAARKSPFVMQSDWDAFIKSLIFEYDKAAITIASSAYNIAVITVPLDQIKFYVRGDSPSAVDKQVNDNLLNTEDPVKLANDIYFNELIQLLASKAGFSSGSANAENYTERNNKEREFHDAWAESEDVESIDVLAANSVCTAPEMRWITQRLGDLKGKTLLDVGCGLGEASVYFALLGADVTSSDLSQGMLNATSRLAERNGVTIKQHLASADNIQLEPDKKFDVIYAGNLLHHVDIEKTLLLIKPHLKPGGLFVSWDPLDYNPVINAYRRVATDVRTPDEHPLKWSDIKLFHKHFGTVETKYFWLSTLSIFIIMALVQKRNPNKERFWKVIVKEGGKWAWLYRPLEKFDSVLLSLIPPLRLLCWNVVIFAKQRP